MLLDMTSKPGTTIHDIEYAGMQYAVRIGDKTIRECRNKYNAKMIAASRGGQVFDTYSGEVIYDATC